MKIQEALRSLPTKPGVIIATIIVVLGGGWQGYSLRESCVYKAGLTSGLTTAIETSAAAGSSEAPVPLNLANVTDFAWDEVQILQNYRLTTTSLDCPFGWHWSEDARSELAAKGLLTVLAFFQNGTFVDFMDHSGEIATFEVSEDKITKAQAQFRVIPSPDGKGPFLVQQLESDES
ncbi:hypothetical protein [Pelagibius sp. Alg239-R121]|uniref:hypothetical protein n=1 Tax=Pelagibius sp. Alg239-R121 TaxID=2993448 RepID=UPI0024A6FDEF|nr:hypothetical protein [Pelagibius sp. Alg239-R121]